MYSRFRQAVLPATIVFALIAFVASPVKATTQWSTVVDINLTSATAYENGYAFGPAKLTATFSLEGQPSVTMPGFWTGDDHGKNFRFRFTPVAQGTWTYVTESTDASLNGRKGTIRVTALAVGKHGFLRVDPKFKTSFVWDDGTRYYMLGQTYYNLMNTVMKGGRPWREAIDNSLAYGMTKVRMLVYPGYWGKVVTADGVTIPDAQPYQNEGIEKPNRDVIDPVFWNKLDEAVQYMESKGMVAELIVTNPYLSNRMYGTVAQNDRFIRYVTARYSAYTNVIWCVGNEWDSPRLGKPYNLTTHNSVVQTPADLARMGALIAATDPYASAKTGKRPLSLMGLDQDGTNFLYATFPWATHAVIQYGRGVPGFPDAWSNAAIVANLGHNMPVVDDEYSYIHSTDPKNPSYKPQIDVRRMMWGLASAGGYGSNEDDSDGDKDPRHPFIDAGDGHWQHVPSYDDMKHLANFFTTKGIEYWKMGSNNGLLRNLSNGARCYLLAEVGRQYVVYAANGGSFSINLPAGKYYQHLYDPTTGATTKQPTVSGGVQTFTMPAAPRSDADKSNDWVLRLSTFE